MAVDPTAEGGSLQAREVDDPVPGPGEVVIDIAAAGVNRADISQRRGGYAPPPGAPDWPGLECAGVVASVGAEVDAWKVGDRVCALLAGGGYAEQVAVPAPQVLAVPKGMDLIHAAAFPEAAATVWSNLVGLGSLGRGDTLLVHGGSSGIGTMAVQVGRLLGARVLVTVGSPTKADYCLSLGAEACIDYRTESFPDRVLELSGGHGADVILDVVGGGYVDDNVSCLATGGRLIVIGLQGGAETTVNLRAILAKEARVTGSMLRSRSPAEKGRILTQVVDHLVPAVETGRLEVVVDSTFALTDAMAAHERMEAGLHRGKIVLVP